MCPRHQKKAGVPDMAQWVKDLTVAAWVAAEVRVRPQPGAVG